MLSPDANFSLIRPSFYLKGRINWLYLAPKWRFPYILQKFLGAGERKINVQNTMSEMATNALKIFHF